MKRAAEASPVRAGKAARREVRRVRVALLGLGGVGRAVAKQLAAARDAHARTAGVAFDLVALGDSRATVLASSGRGGALSDDQVADAVAVKAGGGGLLGLAHAEALPDGGPAALVASIEPASLIVVDCSSSEDTAAALVAAVEAGGGGVTANKKPVTDTADVYGRLAAGGAAARFGYESSVGAGTPMVAAARRLVAGGDTVRSAQGCFSGTLGYLCSGLQAGEKYSEVVTRAHKLGFTEPDPRDDLSGTDVARKALILARIFGARLEMSDVAVEPLFPADLAGVPVADFMAALPRLDGEYSARAAAAAGRGAALRYVARVDLSDPAKPVVGVGMAEVPLDSPLGGLTGTGNMVEFRTDIYGDAPLVVQGAGAGVEITASGVIADMVDVAAAMR